MKNQKIVLLCLLIVSVSLIPLAKAPPVYRNDNEIRYRIQDVDIQYVNDLYYTIFEIDSTLIRVNGTATLFSISNIDSSQATVTFTALGQDAEYNFTWEASTPYLTYINGEVTALTISAFSNNQLNYTANGTSTTSTNQTIQGGTRGSPSSVISNVTGVLTEYATLGDLQTNSSGWYYAPTSNITTIKFPFASPVLITTVFGAPPPPPPPYGIWLTTALEDYNTWLINNGYPYIYGSTNTITALTFSNGEPLVGNLNFTTNGTSGTTGLVTVNCASKTEPFSADGANSFTYSTSTNLAVFNVTYASTTPVDVRWGTPNIVDPIIPGHTSPDGSDLLIQYLLNYDFLGFITSMFTLIIGQSFYAILAMIFSIVLWIRTQSIAFLSLIWILVGGTILVAMPMVSGVAYLLLALGIASMLYKLYTTIR